MQPRLCGVQRVHRRGAARRAREGARGDAAGGDRGARRAAAADARLGLLVGRRGCRGLGARGDSRSPRSTRAAGPYSATTDRPVRVVATAGVPAVAREAFAPIGEIEGERARRSLLAVAEVLIVRGTRLDAALIDGASSLRAIARTGAGYDSLDARRPCAASRSSTPRRSGACAWPRVRSRSSWLPRSASASSARSCTRRHVSRATRSLASTWRAPAWESWAWASSGAAWRPVRRAGNARDRPRPGRQRPGRREVVGLADLLARADVLTFHCALTERTRGLVNRELLSSIKQGAVCS